MTLPVSVEIMHSDPVFTDVVSCHIDDEPQQPGRMRSPGQRSHRRPTHGRRRRERSVSADRSPRSTPRRRERGSRSPERHRSPNPMTLTPAEENTTETVGAKTATPPFGTVNIRVSEYRSGPVPEPVQLSADRRSIRRVNTPSISSPVASPTMAKSWKSVWACRTNAARSSPPTGGRLRRFTASARSRNRSSIASTSSPSDMTPQYPARP